MLVHCFHAAGQGLVSSGIVLSLVVVALVGCGPNEPFTHAQIHGKVTYEDGTPIEAHRVRLIFEPQTPPIDQKTHPRPGETDLAADGTFSDVSSHKYGDGVVVGKHKVVVIPLDDQERETNAVPKEYKRADTTPLEIDTADFSEDNPYHLKIPKK
jgi:hypothetical protein